MIEPSAAAILDHDPHEHGEVAADLAAWLPTVLDDAAMREALADLVCSAPCPPICAAGTSVFTAITGRRPPARLRLAIRLVYVGVELLDDVADGDIKGGSAAEAQATLLAATVLASIAPQAVATLLPSPENLRALHCLWNGLRGMSVGQRRDLRLFGAADPDPRAVEAALEKSTAEYGMYAGLAACVAGVADRELRHWEEFGTELGYALEVNADCDDVLDVRGRDIAAGARTLPIVLALQPGSHADPLRLRRDLAAAKADPAARDAARAAIADSGSLVACGMLVEAAIKRAERIFDLLSPPHGSALRELVSGASFLRTR